MEMYTKKAEMLVEMLPYIQRYNGKIIVVKYGGSAMTDEALKYKVMEDVTLLKLVGFHPIIVHGGGKEISRMLTRLGKETSFVKGLRVTDEETLEIAEMVLGKINKSLVRLVTSLGGKAIGISGKDGHLLQVKKKMAEGQELGFVGEVTRVHTEILQDLIDRDYIPIIYPIGMDENYQGYNINADDVACAVASAMNAEKLAFLTDIKGVYGDPSDETTLLSELTIEEAKECINSGVIGGGMFPKLQNCIDAMRNGVSGVHILDGRIPHCLLLEIFTDHGIGTAMIKERENGK